MIALLLVVIAVSYSYPATHVTADEQLYSQFRADQNHWIWFFMLEARAPNFLDRWLHLGKLDLAMQQKWEAEQRQLVSSGYFTNLIVGVTNFPRSLVSDAAKMTEVLRRVKLRLPPDVYISFSMRSNECNFTCKPSEAARIFSAATAP